MNPLVQRILEVRRELDEARAAEPRDNRVVDSTVDFLAGLEVAASFVLDADDAAVLAADLRRRTRRSPTPR